MGHDSGENETDYNQTESHDYCRDDLISGDAPSDWRRLPCTRRGLAEL
jgi:hypothetical protein